MPLAAARVAAERIVWTTSFSDIVGEMRPGNAGFLTQIKRGLYFSILLTRLYVLLIIRSNPPSEIVMIPDKIPMSTAVNITLIQRLRSTVCECSLKPASSNSVKDNNYVE